MKNSKCAIYHGFISEKLQNMKIGYLFELPKLITMSQFLILLYDQVLMFLKPLFTVASKKLSFLVEFCCHKPTLKPHHCHVHLQ